MKNYVSTLAAILTATVIVLSVRSCSEHLKERAQLAAIERENASPTPYMPSLTPAPSFVRVTMDIVVYGRDAKSAKLKAGDRVRVVNGDGPILQIEYQGEYYALDAALTKPSD